MRRVLLAFAVVAVLALDRQVAFDAQRQSEPPHAAPAAARVDSTPQVVAAAAEAAAEREIAAIAAHAAEEERRGLEEAARLEAARRAASSSGAGGGGRASCEGVDWVVPVGIVVRESGCDFGAVSPGGQYVGAYQFDRRHWDASSGWGGCADLGDWQDPEAQHECARRLSQGGTNLAPWGG